MAKNNSFGLGRGLDVLLPSKEGGVQEVDINRVEPNPYQPRVTFDPQALNDLCTSIKSLGIVQPLTVRLRPSGKYQIISGERRYRAALMAGLTTVPAYVRSTDDTGMLEMAIVENVQREDLDPIETAMSYQRLLEECSLTQEQLADRIGKNRITVTNYIRLLRLPAKVQYDIKNRKLSVGHAKVLLSIQNSELQEKLSDKVIHEGISVRELESIIRELSASEKEPGGEVAGKKKTPAKQQTLPENYCRLLETLGSCCDGNISLKRSNSGKGTLTIRFDDDAQVEKLIKCLKN